MLPYFRSILEQEDAPVVICDLQHTILYMNPAACKAYERWGGSALLGKRVLDCHKPASREAIVRILDWFARSSQNNCVHTAFLEAEALDLYVVALRDETGNLLGYYEKHAFRTKDPAPFYDM